MLLFYKTMTQEVQVTLTLEVDTTQDKDEIEDNIYYLFSDNPFFKSIKIKSIKEESEIYQTE